MTQKFLGIIGGQITEIMETGVTSVTGVAPVVSSGTNTPEISIAKATASVDGYLASTDFTAFSGKAPTASPTFSGVVTIASGSSDLVLDSTGTVANARWRILAQTGNTTKLFRISDDTAGSDRLTINASGAIALLGNVGFNGTAAIAKPTITGSRVANPALASLLTALANYGLITDSTTI